MKWVALLSLTFIVLNSLGVLPAEASCTSRRSTLLEVTLRSHYRDCSVKELHQLRRFLEDQLEQKHREIRAGWKLPEPNPDSSLSGPPSEAGAVVFASNIGLVAAAKASLNLVQIELEERVRGRTDPKTNREIRDLKRRLSTAKKPEAKRTVARR